MRIFVELRVERLRPREAVAQLLAISKENVAAHLEGIARAADDPFDKACSIFWRKEDHDLSIGGLPPLGEAHEGERHFEVVGEFVNRDEVAFEDGGFHGAARNPVPISDGRFDWGDDRESGKERSQPFVPDVICDITGVLGILHKEAVRRKTWF